MRYLDKKFSVGKGNSNAYRAGWEQTFGKSSNETKVTLDTSEDGPKCPKCDTHWTVAPHDQGVLGLRWVCGCPED